MSGSPPRRRIDVVDDPAASIRRPRSGLAESTTDGDVTVITG
ncbi:MAG TPA: hypothetical protein VFG87_29035 [Amycolatopsis sp.]|jgi:hypothetical protein|nr:hypothetical protein [Amycolatopsis sp.]